MKRIVITKADSEGSGEPGHPRSLARAQSRQSLRCLLIQYTCMSLEKASDEEPHPWLHWVAAHVPLKGRNHTTSRFCFVLRYNAHFTSKQFPFSMPVFYMDHVCWMPEQRHGPTHEKREVRVVWLLNLQMHVRSHLEGKEMRLFDASSSFLWCVSEQRRLWRDWAEAIAVRLYDQYLFRMSWFKYSTGQFQMFYTHDMFSLLHSI